MKYVALLEAVTPVAHGDTSMLNNGSNTRIFMRQNTIVNGYPMQVPAISENALRSVMVRTPIHDDLIQRLGIGEGELPQAVVNLLWSGGSMAAGSKAPAQAMEIGHNLKKTYPSLDLLGGAVDGFILPKSRLNLSAWLVCSENRRALSYVAPEIAETAAVSAFDMIAEETRTRGTGSDSEGNQMVYTYETLTAGAQILVEFTLDPHTPDLTLSCLGAALAAWDGFVGGQGRQGRGRMAIVSHDLPAPDAYHEYVAANADTLRDGLKDGTFGSKTVLCA